MLKYLNKMSTVLLRNHVRFSPTHREASPQVFAGQVGVVGLRDDVWRGALLAQAQ